MTIRLLTGDCRAVLPTLPERSVQCVVTSPPYFGLRDYGVKGQIGLETTVEAYVAALVGVFRLVRRVLRDDGTVWLVLGDSFADKQLLGVPWRVAFALQEDGWYLRSDIIWSKPNPMPESVRDRPTRSHEYVFLLTKRATYFYDADAVREPHSETVRRPNVFNQVGPTMHAPPGQSPQIRHDSKEAMFHPNGRNRRSVWTITPKPFSDWTKISRQVRVPWDDASDDSGRITSPDCPLHAGQPDREPTPRGGGRGGDRSSRNPGNGSHLAQAPAFESVPTVPPPALDSAGGSSDLLPLLCAPTATMHSTGSHRTAPVPATSGPCRPSARTPDRTGDTSASPESGAPCDRTPESKTAPDDSGGPLSGQTTFRTAHTSSLICSCEYYDIVTESISHFATFPPDLVEPCVLAGTSEKGCCARCGAPWVRVVERSSWCHRPSSNGIRGHAPSQRAGLGGPQRASMHVDTETLGWSPSCSCFGRWEDVEESDPWSVAVAGTDGENLAADLAAAVPLRGGLATLGDLLDPEHEGTPPPPRPKRRVYVPDPEDPPPVPQVLLDPFGGAGTVGLVADRLGRDAVLIELRPEYAAMADDRIRGDSPLFASVEVGR
jgi:DNA methylase